MVSDHFTVEKIGKSPDCGNLIESEGKKSAKVAAESQLRFDFMKSEY